MGFKLGDAHPAVSSGFSQESHEPITDGIVAVDVEVNQPLRSSAEHGVNKIVFTARPLSDIAIGHALGEQARRKTK